MLGIFVVLVNAVGYVVATHDKRIATSRKGGMRIPERAFFAFALFGGGLGTGLAFWLHRHKTRKLVFLAPFILAAVVGIALTGAWAGLLCPELFR